MEYKTKEKSLKTKKLFAKYHLLQVMGRKTLAYYVIGQGVEGHGVGGAKKILNQALMILRVHHVWKTMRKKPKIMTQMGLCSSQHHGGSMTNSMKGDFPNTIRDVVQANHRNSAPGIDKCRCMIRG